MCRLAQDHRDYSNADLPKKSQLTDLVSSSSKLVALGASVAKTLAMLTLSKTVLAGTCTLAVLNYVDGICSQDQLPVTLQAKVKDALEGESKRMSKSVKSTEKTGSNITTTASLPSSKGSESAGPSSKRRKFKGM